jgi:hypothetical protein
MAVRIFEKLTLSLATVALVSGIVMNAPHIGGCESRLGDRVTQSHEIWGSNAAI